MNLPSINHEFRKYVAEVEALLIQMPQVDCPLKHDFNNGVYCRTISMPAGMLGTGKIHTHPCRNILLQGSMTVWSEHQGRLEIKAPFIWDSPSGTKRVFAIHEDVTWMTIHPTTLDNIPEVEMELFSTSYEEYNIKVGILEGELT